MPKLAIYGEHIKGLLAKWPKCTHMGVMPCCTHTAVYTTLYGSRAQPCSPLAYLHTGHVATCHTAELTVIEGPLANLGYVEHTDMPIDHSGQTTPIPSQNQYINSQKCQRINTVLCRTRMSKCQFDVPRELVSGQKVFSDTKFM